jgi:hypothetical protein
MRCDCQIEIMVTAETARVNINKAIVIALLMGFVIFGYTVFGRFVLVAGGILHVTH